MLQMLALLKCRKLSSSGPKETRAVSTPKRAHRKKEALASTAQSIQRALQQVFLFPAHLSTCQAGAAGAPGKTYTHILFVPVLLSPAGVLFYSIFSLSHRVRSNTESSR